MNAQKYYIKELSRKETIEIYRNIAPTHFPANELKPVSTINLLYMRKAYLGLGLYENTATENATLQAMDTDSKAPHNQLLGYALFLKVPGLNTVLLDYYAILEEYRELGLGSFFLREMKAFFKDKAGILIETEDPTCAENEEEALLRNRRNAFYYKNGAHPTGIACTLFGVPFQIQFMPTNSDAGCQSAFTPEPVTAQDANSAFIRKNMEATYRFMLPKAVYHQNVVWR